MSSIHFHEQIGEAAVDGAERVAMAETLAGVMWSFLKADAREYTIEQPSCLRNVIAGNSWILNERYRGGEFGKALETSLGAGVANVSFLVDGVTTDARTCQLNTALRIGNDALKLWARLHGQCENHAWVDGPNRSWLADIIQLGRSSGLYRGSVGWENVIELLRKNSGCPVVTSYSACERFPNKTIADWEDENAVDEWNCLSSEHQWNLGIENLRSTGSHLELAPETFDEYHFGSGVDAFKILDESRRSRTVPSRITNGLAEMKYIVVRNCEDCEHAIVFPGQINHEDVARIHRDDNLKVVSAGFCTIADYIQAWGRSDSLNLESRKNDAGIIAQDFGNDRGVSD